MSDAIEATAHGAGENFPLDDTGEQLDTAPADNKRDPIDRRVELFFFDPEFGITPPPPGPNSKAGSSQYPAWRKRVAEIIELRADDLDGPKVTFIELADAHFRTNSAVALPEGEDPDKTGTHQALTSVGVIATALRFNEEHPGRTLLVAGHADTTGTPAFNKPLSEERAQLTLALLEGGDSSRETFKKLAQARHTVADIKQILSWAASALPGFNCDPGAIDDNLATASKPVLAFQNSYNAQRATIAPNSKADLKPDGSVGPFTWGAFFDCYEFALQEELGEDAAGLAALRTKLAFVDPEHKSLGFSEHFPIEELGVDHFRSQTNRRVEIHFFEQREEPDIAHALDDPETSDLYLPGHYQRTPLQPMLSAKPWRATWDAPTTSMTETRTMTVIAPDLPAGVPLAFTISALAHGEVGTVFGASTSGGAAEQFSDWDDISPIPFAGSLGAVGDFPQVDFQYVVEGGGRRVESNLVAYRDRALFRLVLDVAGTQQVLADEPFVLVSPWGTLQGVTDAQGVLDENGLPPGGVSIVLRNHTLAHFGVLEPGSDLDGS